MPEAYAELMEVREKLEQHYRDMQDIEFTVQRRKLYMLQTRNGKRTAAASLRMAVEMAHEGLIDQAEAVRRVNPSSLDQLLHPTLDPKAPRTCSPRACRPVPGAASGAVVFSADEAESRALKGEAVILVRIETSPEDIHGMNAARGILTTRGGMTSHAAVVARGMGRPCVAGAGSITVDYGAQTLSSAGKTVNAGEIITLDGAAGEVFVGAVPMIEPAMSGDFGTLMQWADGCRRAGRARQRRDAARRRDGPQIRRRRHRPVPHRAHVLRSRTHRRGAADDHGECRSRPPRRHGPPAAVPARGLPPVFHHHGRTAGHHPAAGPAVARVPAAFRGRRWKRSRRRWGRAWKRSSARGAELAEANPMLGHRGCRLGISFPEIYQMQARAIFEGAIAVAKETGKAPHPEIMIPLVATRKELEITRAKVDGEADAVFAEAGTTIEYSVGTMIELPRAAHAGGSDRRDRGFLQLRHQ